MNTLEINQNIADLLGFEYEVQEMECSTVITGGIKHTGDNVISLSTRLDFTKDWGLLPLMIQKIEGFRLDYHNGVYTCTGNFCLGEDVLSRHCKSSKDALAAVCSVFLLCNGIHDV